MKAINGVAHIGLTVASLEKSVAFYTQSLGMRLHRTHQFGEAFFESHRGLYHLPAGTLCKTAVLESPDGLQMELFEFSQTLEAAQTPWNRPGYTHFAVLTDDVPALADQLRQNGAEFTMEIGVRPDGGHWVFVRDPDGNLIEVMEPFAADKKG